MLIKEKEKIKISEEKALVLSNITESISLPIIMSSKRIEKKDRINIKVNYPPKIENIRLVIKMPTRKQPLELNGLYEIEVEQGSLVSQFISYQSEQEITGIKITKNEQNISLKYDIIDLNSIKFVSKIKENSQISFVVTNKNNQVSEERTFTFLVKKNQVPKISFTSSKSFLQLVKQEEELSKFNVQDDQGLKSIEFQWEVFSKKNKLISKRKVLIDFKVGKTSVSSEFLISPSKWKLPEGVNIRYFIKASDFGKLVGYSVTNTIFYGNSSDFYQELAKEKSKIKKSIYSKEKEFNNITKEYEKLQILSEKNQLNQEDLKNFKSNLSEISEKLQEDIKDLSRMQRNNDSEENASSLSILKKVDKIKETLKKIDKDLLRKFISPLNHSQVDPKKMEAFMKKMDPKKTEKMLNQVIEGLKYLSNLQKLNTLKKLSANIYERYKDLESYLSDGEIDLEDIEIEIAEIKSELLFLKKEYLLIKNDLPKTKNIKKITQGIDKRLSKSNLEEIEKVPNEQKNYELLNKISKRLFNLRNDFGFLNNMYESINIEKIIITLENQIFSINDQSKWLSNIIKDEIYDISYLNDLKKQLLITSFLSKHHTMIHRFKENLYLLSASTMLNIDFFEIYDNMISIIEDLQKKNNPATSLKKLSTDLKVDFKLVQENNNLLISNLIELKLKLLEEQKNQANNNKIESLKNQQQHLNDRINNSFSKKNQNFQQIANEQKYLSEYLRKLLEENNQRRSFQRKGRSKESQRIADFKKKLTEINEKMKLLEEELRKKLPDRKKINKLQQFIDKNLEKYIKDIKSQLIEKSNEFEAEKEKKNYKLKNIKEISNKDLNLNNQKDEINSLKQFYPKEYKNKIELFLKESLN